MATRQYTITTGDYSGYRIVGRIEGPAKPALSTLNKRFREQFYPPKDETSSDLDDAKAVRQYRSIMREHREQTEAEHALKTAGYEGYDVAELFIDWLCKEHGYRVLPSDLFHVG